MATSKVQFNYSGMKLKLRFPVIIFLMVSLLLSGCKDRIREYPNIVFILADDMGYGDPQCYRPDSKIPTPYIDLLAKEGIRFTDAHSPSSVCSPTRYGILTGRYCWRTPLKSGALWPYDYTLIEKERLTLPGLLKNYGYTTACFGKWHLGWNWGLKDQSDMPWEFGSMKTGENIDHSKTIGGGPLEAGFDSYFGVDAPNFPPYCFIEDNRIVGELSGNLKPNGLFFGSGGQMQKGWDVRRVLPEIEKKAVRFIKNQSGNHAPFFLYMPLTGPHTPIVQAESYRDRSQAGDYGDFVAQCDGVLGSVVRALKETGQYKNTILVFTSDNGSPGRAGDPFIRQKVWGELSSVKLIFDHDPSAPWKGVKADIWEGGHRVPCIVQWPEKIEKGVVSEQSICLTDFFATFAAILDYELKENEGEDSFDILAVLLGKGKSSRDHLVHHSSSGIFSIRKEGWKYIPDLGSGGMSYPNSEEPVKDGPCGQLYNLKDDPQEHVNLWLEFPEKVTELEQLLGKIQKSDKTRF